MNLKELKELVDYYYHDSRYAEQTKVCIKVFRAGSIGGTPTIEVTKAYGGIDWDSGKFILLGDTDLREIDRDEIAAIMKQYDELGWKHYEIRNLKRERDSYKKQYEDLKFRMDGLDK